MTSSFTRQLFPDQNGGITSAELLVTTHSTKCLYLAEDKSKNINLTKCCLITFF